VRNPSEVSADEPEEARARLLSDSQDELASRMTVVEEPAN
jgi:hypothetical protein